MAERIQLEILRTWDGKDTETTKAADLKLVLPNFRPETYGVSLSAEAKREVFAAIARELQPIVDQRFGSGSLRVMITRIASGSLDVWLALVTTGGAVYAFLKDYEDLRKGLLLFVGDVKQLGQRFEKRIGEVYNAAVRKELARRQRRNQEMIRHRQS